MTPCAFYPVMESPCAVIAAKGLGRVNSTTRPTYGKVKAALRTSSKPLSGLVFLRAARSVACRSETKSQS